VREGPGAAQAEGAARRAARRGEAGPVRGDRGLLAPAGTKRRAQVGPSPVDRGRPGSKHHLITNAQGDPARSDPHRRQPNDVTQLIPLLQPIPKIRGARGRPTHRPGRVYGDRGYDHDSHRHRVRALSVTPVIAHRGAGHGSGFGKKRWHVERTFAWLHAYKRLRGRYERRADTHQALLSLAAR
jgi:transposase